MICCYSLKTKKGDLLRAALAVHLDAELSVVAGAGRYDEELDELRRIRDELRVQIHLGKAEATILWDELFVALRGRDFDGCLMLELTDMPDAARALAEGWDWMNRALEAVS